MEAKNTWKLGTWGERNGEVVNTRDRAQSSCDPSTWLWFFFLPALNKWADTQSGFLRTRLLCMAHRSSKCNVPLCCRGRGTVRGLGMGLDTLLYLKRTASEDPHAAQGPLLSGRWQPDGRGVWGERIHVRVWLSPFMFTWNCYIVNWLYSNTK